jgi:aspartate-semialdehyde dehydrogenase
MKKFKLAVVGTDSLRGKEIKSILSQERIPHEKIDFFDPDVKEEYGKLTQFRGEAKVIHCLESDALQSADLVFLAADKKVNQEIGTLAKKKKFQAIDLSEAFNTEDEIPVVVAGVNDGLILKKRPSLIANPHPVTVILSHLFHLVIQKFGLSKAVAFILQPASAFENEGIGELIDQSLALLNSSTMSKKVFREQIAFNLLSHTERPEKDGFSPAEKQIVSEVKRVLGKEEFPLSLSLIQAPVFHTYSIMTFLELKKKSDLQGLKDLFKENAFFKLCPPSISCPVSSVSVAGKKKIHVGQIKKEESFPNSFWVWTVADNLTRGSALNAFEIAKKIFTVSLG